MANQWESKTPITPDLKGLDINDKVRLLTSLNAFFKVQEHIRQGRVVNVSHMRHMASSLSYIYNDLKKIEASYSIADVLRILREDPEVVRLTTKPAKKPQPSGIHNL